jgi:hypothetical protein
MHTHTTHRTPHHSTAQIELHANTAQPKARSHHVRPKAYLTGEDLLRELERMRLERLFGVIRLSPPRPIAPNRHQTCARVAAEEEQEEEEKKKGQTHMFERQNLHMREAVFAAVHHHVIAEAIKPVETHTQSAR